jgi:hypothetical protein
MIETYQTTDQVSETVQRLTGIQMTAGYKFACYAAYCAIICIVLIFRGQIPAEQNN